jgi:hypothetical protein
MATTTISASRIWMCENDHEVMSKSRFSMQKPIHRVRQKHTISWTFSVFEWQSVTVASSAASKLATGVPYMKRFSCLGKNMQINLCICSTHALTTISLLPKTTARLPRMSLILCFRSSMIPLGVQGKNKG